MNEITRWVLGIMFALILGAYGYTFSTGQLANAANESLENRITRQLDIIEHKVDRVIEHQYNEDKRR